jgi:SAM-dependent methyltransferase
MFFRKPTTPEQIEAGFRKRGLWITCFKIGGRAYGGAHAFDADPRIGQFFEAFPRAHTILELGSLEGGQTFQLAKRPGVSLLAVEGRKFNLDKARYVQKLLEVENVRFAQADLEKRSLASFGQFDAVFNSGLLYHLPRPWELLDQLRAAAPRVFLWTHYAAEDNVTETINGFPGHWFREHGPSDPLSGLSPKSFWITLASLIARLKQNGFDQIKVIEDNPHHQNGPSVTLAAWVGEA